MYVLPMENHELELAIASTCAMSCNVVLQDCTRHTRTLPLLTGLEGDLCGPSSFTGALTWTHECARGKRA
jgi:hypothetical protein